MLLKTLGAVATAAALLTLTGCNAVNSLVNERVETVEYYRIYDIHTDAKITPVVNAAIEGLSYTTQPRSQRHIPAWSELPEKPGRFKLKNMLNPDSGLARMMAASGQTMGKIADCEGAIWTAVADRDSKESGAHLYACLWPYKGGYHLDMYATFMKRSGSLTEVSRQLAYAMVGTPEQWVEKMFMDAPREIRKKTGAEVTLIEAYPEVGSTTWLDEGDAIKDESKNNKF